VVKRVSEQAPKTGPFLPSIESDCFMQLRPSKASDNGRLFDASVTHGAVGSFRNDLGPAGNG